MRLAKTSDSAAEPAEAGSADAQSSLRRLSTVWDEAQPELADAPHPEGDDVIGDAADHRAHDERDEHDDRERGIRELYERRHADMVRFAAFLTGDVNVAEDIAHDAFAKVFDAWDRIDDLDRVDAYLKSTVVNLVRGGHRKQQVAERQPTPHLTVVPSAEDDAIDEFRRRRTLDAVAALPLRQRACVVMRHWMRMTESEIADTLELSVGSVRTHIKRGMESLKHSLGAPS